MAQFTWTRSHCGCALKPTYTQKADQRYHYYICAKHAKAGEESSCPVQRIPARVVEQLVLESVGALPDQPEVIEKLLQSEAPRQAQRIRALKTERASIKKQLKELEAKVRSLTDKLLAVAGTIVSEHLQEQAEALTQDKRNLVAEEVRLDQLIRQFEITHLDAEKVALGFRHFAQAIATLSEAEQYELYRLLFAKVVVSEGEPLPDPGLPANRRCRMQRRQLSLTITLRGAAIQALASGQAQASGKAKNLRVPLVIAHSRSNSKDSFALLSPIYKECGSSPKGRARKQPPKTQHEIHKAVRWKNEMQRMGMNESKFSRKLGISRNAVNAVLKWLKLSAKQQELLLALSSTTEIRKYSRRWRDQRLRKR